MKASVTNFLAGAFGSVGAFAFLAARAAVGAAAIMMIARMRALLRMRFSPDLPPRHPGKYMSSCTNSPACKQREVRFYSVYPLYWAVVAPLPHRPKAT